MNLFIKFDGHKMQSYRQNVNNLDVILENLKKFSTNPEFGCLSLIFLKLYFSNFCAFFVKSDHCEAPRPDPIPITSWYVLQCLY